MNFPPLFNAAKHAQERAADTSEYARQCADESHEGPHAKERALYWQAVSAMQYASARACMVQR